METRNIATIPFLLFFQAWKQDWSQQVQSCLIFIYLLLFTRPTTLDVMVYGHMHALMTTDLPSNDLATVALRFKNLGDFCRTTVPGMTSSQAHI